MEWLIDLSRWMNSITLLLVVIIAYRITIYCRRIDKRIDLIFSIQKAHDENICYLNRKIDEIIEKLQDIKQNTTDLNLRVNIAEVRLDERKHPTTSDILANRPPRLPYAGAKRGPKPKPKIEG